MELVLLLIAIGALVYVSYRAFIATSDLKKSGIPENETPVAPVLTQTCGCGRSPTGYCVGLHSLTDEEWAVHDDNPNKKKPRKSRVKKQDAA